MVDVVVLGGGVMGASVAFHLAQRRAGTILLLDRWAIAAGQTGHSSAVIRMHYAAEPMVRLALHSLEVFQHFQDVVGGPCGFTASGYAALTGSGDQSAFVHNVAMQRAAGVETYQLSAAEVQALMPAIYVGDVVHGAYEPHSGYADPWLTTASFAAAAQERGVDVRPNAAADRILADGSGVLGVEVCGEVVTTRRVIACLGVWSNRLLGPLGIALPIQTIREEMAIFEHPPDKPSHMVVHDVDQGVYLRPEGSSITLLGNTDRRRPREVVDPDSYQRGVRPNTVEHLAAAFVHRFPVAAAGNVRGGYAGLYDVTPDMCPVVEETPVRGLYVAAGFSGQGFKIAPAIGALVAELVTEGTAATVGIPSDFFASRRFLDGRPIRGGYVYRKDVVSA